MKATKIAKEMEEERAILRARKLKRENVREDRKHSIDKSLSQNKTTQTKSLTSER